MPSCPTHKEKERLVDIDAKLGPDLEIEISNQITELLIKSHVHPADCAFDIPQQPDMTSLGPSLTR